MSSKDTATKDSDVLDFINSLPDSKPSTPKPAAAGGNKEDLFDFLDELAEHEKKKLNKVLSPKVTANAQAKKVDSSNEEDPTTGTTTDKSDTTNEDIEQQQKEDNEEGMERKRMNSLWKNITTNAEKISEQTYKLANETTNQLNTKSKNINSEEITHRLNSLFLNISNQIKQGLIEENDEVLNILIVCDLFNLKYLKYLVFNNFELVMRQVEGSIRTSVNELSSHHEKEEDKDKVKLNMFYGKLIDGEKLCFANLENGIKDYKSLESKHEEIKGEEEEKKEKKEEEEITQSNIFISIQPVTTKIEGQDQEEKEDKTIVIESNDGESFSFVIVLKDISNDITIITKSQPMPLRWAQWLDGEKLKSLQEEETEEESIDPKEWVKDWIRQSLNLSIGVLAQEYVIKRMGV
ncbi:Maintenance of telomere capping protein 1 [Candida viswanathii]|uniref:Maintenance of telomere capping protein 1 n=1 Tax=Candida viswanathii TaxID=5486 RepID=A0A367YKF6_9ASCO|nr:Maintenance of telomere capping protein 1 [Candida viswanathii]